MAMTGFDRLAWRCSYVAPWALVGAIVSGILASRDASRSNLYAGLAVILACVGILAHMVVHYHAVRPASFRRAKERSRLEVAAYFSNYAPWRQQMRAEHPELRTGDENGTAKLR